MVLRTSLVPLNLWVLSPFEGWLACHLLFSFELDKTEREQGSWASSDVFNHRTSTGKFIDTPVTLNAWMFSDTHIKASWFVTAISSYKCYWCSPVWCLVLISGFSSDWLSDIRQSGNMFIYMMKKQVTPWYTSYRLFIRKKINYTVVVDRPMSDQTFTMKGSSNL